MVRQRATPAPLPTTPQEADKEADATGSEPPPMVALQLTGRKMKGKGKGPPLQGVWGLPCQNPVYHTDMQPGIIEAHKLLANYKPPPQGEPGMPLSKSAEITAAASGGDDSGGDSGGGDGGDE